MRLHLAQLFKREFLSGSISKRGAWWEVWEAHFCRRKLKESKGTNSQTELRVIFSGTKTKIINCWLEFQGEGTASIYCAQKSRWSTASFIAAVQYGFSTVFQDSLGTFFQKNQAQISRKKSGTFPRVQAEFWAQFSRAVLLHLMQSVQYDFVTVLAQKSRAFWHRNWGLI